MLIPHLRVGIRRSNRRLKRGLGIGVRAFQGGHLPRSAGTPAATGQILKQLLELGV
jgi:hypothetical protein